MNVTQESDRRKVKKNDLRLFGQLVCADGGMNSFRDEILLQPGMSGLHTLLTSLAGLLDYSLGSESSYCPGNGSFLMSDFVQHNKRKNLCPVIFFLPNIKRAPPSLWDVTLIDGTPSESSR